MNTQNAHSRAAKLLVGVDDPPPQSCCLPLLEVAVEGNLKRKTTLLIIGSSYHRVPDNSYSYPEVKGAALGTDRNSMVKTFHFIMEFLTMSRAVIFILGDL